MSKKYVKDYRLSDSVDASGKLHSEYQYIGGSFYRTAEPSVARHESVLLAVLCGIGWVCWLLPLLFNNGAMHQFYISYPYIFAALTLWLLSMAAYTALTAPDPMTHKQSDKLTNWIPGTSLATAILSGIALVGTVVTMIVRPDLFNSFDWLFIACAAVLCGIGVTVFTLRKFFKTEERK